MVQHTEISQDNCQAYIEEIAIWQKASKVHAQKAIEQYRRVTENLEAFHKEKERNQAILDDLSDGVVVFNQAQEIVIWNQMAARIFDFTSLQAVGQDVCILLELVAPELVGWLEHLHGQGHCVSGVHERIFTFGQCTYRVKKSELSVLDEYYHVLLLEDITQLVKLEQQLRGQKDELEQTVQKRTRQLRKMVHTDPLTGATNRLGFQQALQKAIKRARNSEDQRAFALLYLDLDGFKAVNDALGHHAGDILLKTVIQRLNALVRQHDLVARLAGDEFAVLLNGVKENTPVTQIAKKLIDAIKQPVVIDEENGVQANVGASIGIYQHMPGIYDLSQVINMADYAMYEAKRRGKGRVVLFEDGMLEDLSFSSTLSMQLDRALEKGEIKAFVQPIMTPEGLPVCAEALARWQHEGEWISPATFIPLMEKRGLIGKMTYQLIEQVAHHLVQNPALPSVSVNLSIQQFFDEAFIPHLEQLLKTHPGVKGRIGFEITESMLDSDAQRLKQQLAYLRSLGFRISIDDFGTGYSSFAYIRDFPANVLKIDRSFVTNIETSERDLNLLTGMMALVRELGLMVVIEGVERKAQLDLLRTRAGDDFLVQGFVFAKPMPIDAWQV